MDKSLNPDRGTISYALFFSGDVHGALNRELMHVRLDKHLDRRVGSFTDSEGIHCRRHQGASGKLCTIAQQNQVASNENIDERRELVNRKA